MENTINRIVLNKIAQLEREICRCSPENLELYKNRLDKLYEWRDNIIPKSRSH